LYSLRTRIGTENAADFPSPVAVQQRTLSPSRIAVTRSSCTGRSPFVHSAITFLTMMPIVLRPSSSFQRILGAIEVSWHGLGLIVDRNNKKTRPDSIERGWKEPELTTRRGRDDRHRHRGGVDYVTSAYPDRGPVLNNRLSQRSLTDARPGLKRQRRKGCSTSYNMFCIPVPGYVRGSSLIQSSSYDL
jgi:hypothetical protein